MSDTKQELYNQSKPNLKKEFFNTLKAIGEFFYKVICKISNPGLNDWADNNLTGLWSIFASIVTMALIVFLIGIICYGLYGELILPTEHCEWRVRSTSDSGIKMYQPIQIVKHGSDRYGPKFTKWQEAAEYIRNNHILFSEVNRAKTAKESSTPQ